MSKVIEKSKGVNPSEQYLKKLCDRTFLALWSYPNLYRDQGVGGNNEGKELCDLLVVFDNHVIIFSDKHCAFPDTGDLELDWKRWHKRTVIKAAEQAWGTVRWIQQFPNRIFLDKKCTTLLPIGLDVTKPVTYHLVVVAHGASSRCTKELGATGSLMFNSDIVGLGANHEPFTLGDLDPKKPFVHVLDDKTVNIVLGVRDTIYDFTEYLAKKEAFIRGNRKLFYAGEEELLAHYLKYVNEQGEHDFIVEDKYTGIAFVEGIWEEFSRNPQRLAQIKADKISYVWDRLIDTFGKHALEGTSEFTLPEGIDTSERIMRFLAKEPRTRRRMLARAFMEALEKTPKDKQNVRYCLGTNQKEPTYVFLLLPYDGKKDYKEYRKVRRAVLSFYCRVAKVRKPDATDIIGIATESGIDNVGRSEDALYFNAESWSEKDKVNTLEEMEELGVSTEPQNVHYSREEEYPEVEVIPPKKMKNMRNKPCPCGRKKPDGSPMKYKHCHGNLNRILI